jgi:hypothetical protein
MMNTIDKIQIHTKKGMPKAKPSDMEFPSHKNGNFPTSK